MNVGGVDVEKTVVMGIILFFVFFVLGLAIHYVMSKAGQNIDIM